MEYLPFPVKEYQMACLSPEETFPSFGLDLFLYLQPAHLALQTGAPGKVYVLLKEEKVVALVPVFFEGKIAFSSWRAPFGGLQAGKDLPPEVVKAFLLQLHHTLKAAGVEEIKWSQCPDVYSPETNERLRHLLSELGYTLQYDQRNHHLPVTDEPFQDVIHSSARRRLQKCLKASFTVQQETLEQLPEAYALLQECRAEKQKPLSLSLPQLQNYFQLFPQRYQLFTVRRGAELAAVGVVVRINEQILNHLYPASPQRLNTYSPTVLLTQGIYAYCQLEKMSMLDLGVSAPPQEGEEDYQGLFTFKVRLGGVESFKPSFLWCG